LPNITEHFAHVLLFACPQCERPLASACASTKQKLGRSGRALFQSSLPLWMDRVGHRNRSGQALGAAVARVHRRSRSGKP